MARLSRTPAKACDMSSNGLLLQPVVVNEGRRGPRALGMFAMGAHAYSKHSRKCHSS